MFKVTDWGVVFLLMVAHQIGYNSSSGTRSSNWMPEQGRTPTIQTLSCIPEAKTKCSPIEWLEKRGSGIWTVFGVRLMLFPKAWSPTTAPLFAEKSFFLWGVRAGNQTLALEQFSAQSSRCRETSSAYELGWDGDPDASSSRERYACEYCDSWETKSSFVNTGCFWGNAAGQLHACYNNFVTTARPRNFCHIFWSWTNTW